MNEDHGESGSLSSGPFDLQYRIEGRGDPLLIIGSAVYYPRTFSPGLRQERKLVFVDHRGFAPARSAVSAGDFAFDTVLADIERLRVHLGLEGVAVLGHSGHGYMALEYAKRYPAHVSHAILVGTGPSQGPRHMAMAERRWEETVCPERKRLFEHDMQQLEADIAAAPDQRFKALLIRLGAKSWHDPAFDARPLWEGVTVNDAGFDHLWGEVFRDIDITAGLEGLDIPVLLALGRCDYLVAPDHAWDAYRPAFRDLTIRVFENSGHTPQLEEPALFDATLLSFLG